MTFSCACFSIQNKSSELVKWMPVALQIQLVLPIHCPEFYYALRLSRPIFELGRSSTVFEGMWQVLLHFCWASQTIVTMSETTWKKLNRQ